MARQSTRAGDYTGRTKVELAEKHAKEQEARAAQIAMATAETEASRLEEPQDLTPITAPVQEEVVGDVLATTDVDVEEPMVEFRVNENLEQVTIGHGNNYDFVQGQKYRAPRWIVNHLEEKGLIWH